MAETKQKAAARWEEEDRRSAAPAFAAGEEERDVKRARETAPTLPSSSSLSLRKGSGGGANQQLQAPCCQAEECAADLTEAKRYHRRHKVCEQHFKAPVVFVAGLRQRFCQQCSRFHELTEFDQTKRSCRRRLAGHNERRRKNCAESHPDASTSIRKGGGPRLKENQCRQADQSEMVQIRLPGSSTFKHFQIR